MKKKKSFYSRKPTQKKSYFEGLDKEYEEQKSAYQATPSRLIVINDNVDLQKKGLENIHRKKIEEKRKKDLFQERLKIKLQIPSDLQIAQKHNEAMYMRHYRGTMPTMQCDCCGNYHDGYYYKMMEEAHRFMPYGGGISLLYLKMFYASSIILAITLFAVVYHFVFIEGGNPENNNDSDIVNRSANRVVYLELNDYFMVSIFIYAFFYLVLFLVSRKMLIAAKAELGTDSRSAQHYSVMLENLPVVAEFNENDFMERTVQNRQEKLDIAQTSFCYDISELYEMYQEYIENVQTVTHIECYRRTLQFRAERDHERIDEIEMNKKYPFRCPLCFVRASHLEDCKRRIEDLGKTIAGQKGMIKSQVKRAPWAFLTFRSAEDCYNFLLDYETNIIERIFDWSRLHFERYPIFVYPAPEAREILWENLGYGNYTRIPRLMLTYFYTEQDI